MSKDIDARLFIPHDDVMLTGVGNGCMRVCGAWCAGGMKMNKFIVWFVIDDDIVVEGFHCAAEDEAHAREQCLNAYPDCEIVEVEPCTK